MYMLADHAGYQLKHCYLAGKQTKLFWLWSQLQNSGWMSGNPTLSPFSEWNEMHGGSMDRNSSPKMGQRGEADRRSRVLQLALWPIFIAACLAMGGVDLASAATNKVGAFTAVAGSVDTLREQQNAPIAAQVGMTTILKDVIRTKHRSRTQLRFIDNSILNMGPDYVVKINDYVYDKDTGVRKAILDSLRGTVRATIAKMGGDVNSLFEIHTPTAVVSVRGTDFIVRINSAMQTEVITLEGLVAVRNVNPKIPGTVLVAAGEKTTISRNKPPTPVVTVPMQMQQLLIAETTPPESAHKSSGSSTPAQQSTSGKKVKSSGKSPARGDSAMKGKQSAPGSGVPQRTGARPAPPIVGVAPPPPPPPPAAPRQLLLPSPGMPAGQPAKSGAPPVQPPATQINPGLVTVPVNLNVVF